MNKTTTYMGIVGIIFILASIIYTYKYAPIKPNTDSQSGNQSGISDDNSDNSNSEPKISIFTDPGEQFSFQYPEEFTVIKSDTKSTNEWRQNPGVGELGLKKATIIIPRTYIPNTNFSEAEFTVSFGTNQKSTDNCLKNINNSGEVKSKVDINGVEFSKFSYIDAAMGNRYEVNSYRTVRKGQCIIVEYLIHSTNIELYDENQNIKEFDKSKIQAILENIVNSFRLPTSIGGLVGDNISGTLSTSPSQNNPSNNTNNPTSSQVTIKGKFSCLPHKDTSGPVTMECAYGIKETSTGNYYAIDISSPGPEGDATISGEGEIEIKGLLVPIEAVSSNTWQKYNIKGIIKVDSVNKI